MPFTMSHAAAVLPLHAASRGRLPLAALVVGSMMPDLGYFFAPTKVFSEDNHNLVGSFTFSLPCGLVVLALLSLLQVGWSALLPEPLRPSGPVVVWTPRALPLLGAAVVLGAWTHGVWDAWTHAPGWFVQRIPPLRAEVAAGMRVYHLLQHLSSILGAAVLIFVLRHRLRALRWDWRVGFWAGALALAMLLALVEVARLEGRAALFGFVIATVRNLVVAQLTAATLLTLAAVRSRSRSGP